ncbi:MAG: crossover junction endodeoxyribonuclease RuvC [Candidatus Pacebacteria bacterium]|nr:crossover junction endodeoxyribonuclease RuvC [Candidatus Paceibacterota bacterium]
MIILGVDPGTATTGFGVIESQINKLKVLDFGCIETDKNLDMPERLNLIAKELQQVIKKHKPQVMAVEELFFFKNNKTIITVGQARGVILFIGKNQGLEICEYTPLQVKQAVVGYGRAEKKQVQQMVKSILGLKEIPKPDDAADALAVAVCCESSIKFAKAVQGGAK